MFEGYSLYKKDKRRSEYTDYIRENAFDLGLLNINSHETVMIKKILPEKRKTTDYYKIILCLQEFNINYDCIQQIIKTLIHREPLSTREWYMNMYDIVRESKVVPVFCSWYGSQLGRFYTPKQRFNLLYDNKFEYFNCSKNIYITFPEKTEDIQIYKFNNSHYDRILNHKAIYYQDKYYWTKNITNHEWVRKKSLKIYVPYTISWDSLRHKWSKEFIETNKRKLTLKRYVSLNPLSKWLRIECGNRYYYHNKESGKNVRQISEEDGFYDINITDIYYFDEQYPIM
jgi:hypothetical protein